MHTSWAGARKALTVAALNNPPLLPSGPRMSHFDPKADILMRPKRSHHEPVGNGRDQRDETGNSHRGKH